MNIACTTRPIAFSTIAPSRPAVDDGNPWGLPKIDKKLAIRGLAAIDDAKRSINRLIDRSIAVRVKLDQDIRSKTLSSDTVHAVDLLVRARDYANERVQDEFMPRSLITELEQWARGTGDARLRDFGLGMRNMRNSMYDLLDDDEGNNRERIANMHTAPTLDLWKSVRGILDGGIEHMYATRDASSTEHVLRAGSGMYS